MENILKQVVGIDVAKKELVVTLARTDYHQAVEILGHKVLANNHKGFGAMVQWVEKLTVSGPAPEYIMEATGVYHQALAYYLSDAGRHVSVVLPNKISNFSRTLDINTVTDKTASQTIARFGLGRKMTSWNKPKKIFNELKQLTREREQLVQENTMLKNQLHAEKSGAFPNQGSIGRIRDRIELVNRQQEQIMKELEVLARSDNGVSAKIDNMTTIPGVGMLTAIVVLAETNDFELISSARQLVSYSGLDVKLKDSGTSVKGKPRISKKGNRYLRKAMHMPALSAIRHNHVHKSLFTRLISRHGIRMKALVAVQRKLLQLIYTIAEKGIPFNEKYGVTQEILEVGTA